MKQHIGREAVISAPRTAALSFILKGYMRVRFDRPRSATSRVTRVLGFPAVGAAEINKCGKPRNGRVEKVPFLSGQGQVNSS